MSQWRPIETAPKDGTPVLVARNLDDWWGWNVGWATWEGEGYVSGWVSRGFGETPGNLGLAHPTHWMPLPPPPQQEEG